MPEEEILFLDGMHKYVFVHPEFYHQPQNRCDLSLYVHMYVKIYNIFLLHQGRI